MERIYVYEDHEEEGRILVGWFDRHAATAYNEDTWWDGSNHVSVATNSQWEHQRLYRTRGGRWVLHAWSQWQGSRPTWTFVADDRARDWLLLNLHEDAAQQHFGEEPERGPYVPTKLETAAARVLLTWDTYIDNDGGDLDEMVEALTALLNALPDSVVERITAERKDKVNA